jgi:hypothetical protein
MKQPIVSKNEFSLDALEHCLPSLLKVDTDG